MIKSSVRIDKLTVHYLEFCTKEGYKPINIEEDGNDELKEFNLKMIYRADKSSEAYVNIKWKTPLEKENESSNSQIVHIISN